MKRNLSYITLLCTLSLAAQHTETTDSLNVNLEEIQVQAIPVIRKADKSIYTVNESVKERSASTLDLLKNINIPELSVNEVMQKVTSSLGSVQIRVNGREIDVEKLKAINRENITKIEWIDNPGLRYGANVGAVVNIIVVNPTKGGSLGIESGEGLKRLFNNSSFDLTLNSGASQWQLGTSGQFRDLGMYRQYNDSYSLPDGTTLQRTQEPLDGYYLQQSINPYVSYNYLRPDTTNFYVGFNVWDKLKEDALYDGIIDTDISRNGEKSRLIDRTNTPRYITPSLNIYLEQKFQHNQTLVVSTEVSYNTSSTERSYMEKEMTAETDIVSIHNAIKSNSWGYYLEGNYIKNWDKAGQLTVGLRYNHNNIKSTYLDYDDQSVEQLLNKIYFFGEYTVPYKKFQFTAGLGGTWNSSKVKESKITSSLDFTPKLTVNWRASDKSRWNFSYGNWVVSPTSTQLSPVTQAIDGIQMECGNPDLKSYVQHYMRLRYGYSNNKNFNLSAYLYYSHISNPIFKYYTWLDDNILRSYSNEGAYNVVSADVSASWEAIADWMSLSAELKFIRYHSRGRGFKHSLNTWMQSIGLQVYHWNCVLGFELNDPAESLFGEELQRGERFNIISFSYRWNNWTFSAMMFMPFGTYSQSAKVISELVNQSTELRSHSVQRMPMLRVSYNLNWGHQKRSARRKLSGSAESGGGASAAGR